MLLGVAHFLVLSKEPRINPHWGGRLMAHEFILKSLVDGLENMAGDFEKFGVLLNQRAEVYGFSIRFKPTPYHTPRAPNYPSKEESLARAADFEEKIADNYGLVVSYFRIQSDPPTTLSPESYGEDGLLDLIASWQRLCAGVFKVTLNLYGEKPLPPPPASQPGAASELRLCAEIAAWLEKIAADSTLFSASQGLSKASKSRATKLSPAPVLDSLARLEQAFHRTTSNALLVANKLPHHLYRAAHKSYGATSKKPTR
jgi:hypothetical protein